MNENNCREQKTSLEIDGGVLSEQPFSRNKMDEKIKLTQNF